ncbi:M1 family aminopeptidase [Oceanihabitans sediminis]|uniref:M1 family aminopeptidase n=1 Tax=Oceanihabitans sediminis TaxID=1812012 RepID=UPI00299E44D7|nr:M1 family aminopeptidase [Oceanihabitans sediminis]MDX1278060.1 M1 family aminopeptidase [Oceanihabitans sediminis]
MKYYILLFFLFPLSLTFAQTYEDDLNTIAEAEMKSASNRIYNQRVNFNTGNYDVTYHKLEFTVDPSVSSISGVVTTHFVAKENMNEVTFDLTNNMVVSQVLQNGNSLTFSQNSDDELVITLFQTLNQGETGIVEITYSGNPLSSGFGSFAQTTHNGAPIIWTLSEPYGAKGWWPCKQDLNDKIDSLDVYITTPVFNGANEEYIAVSNGVEQSQVINGNFKTTHYKHEFPIPAYLVAIAATNYEVYSHTVDNNGNPFEIVNYVYPENLATAQESTAITVDIMELFSTKFEEYPYASEKYGHAQFGWGGGMEHTTVSFMGSFGRNLIAHELAHQWFGNKITCGSWKDIWLNEGFANYLSGLVVEDFDGEESFKNWRQSSVNLITSQLDGAVYLTDADTTNVNRIFSSRLSYNKGSMVLHMLRKKLGDTDFYQGMQDYLSDSELAFDYAKTPDYIAKMEAASGQNLTEFFDDWIYNEGYPSYNIQWAWLDTNQIQLQVNQTQSHPSVAYFEAPIPIRINGVQGEVLDIVLDNTFEGETFLQTVNFEISEILFDPEVHLISKNNNVTLSTSNLILSDSIFLYPNPSKNYFKIEKPDALKIYDLSIYDVLGKIVLEAPYQEQVDVQTLSSGVHFVKFSTNQGVLFKRLLKD